MDNGKCIIIDRLFHYHIAQRPHLSLKTEQRTNKNSLQTTGLNIFPTISVAQLLVRRGGKTPRTNERIMFKLFIAAAVTRRYSFACLFVILLYYVYVYRGVFPRYTSDEERRGTLGNTINAITE